MSTVTSAFQEMVLDDGEEEVYPQVDYQVVFPNAYPTSEVCAPSFYTSRYTQITTETV